MNKLKQLLRQPGFQLFLFFLLFVPMNWPYLAIPAAVGLKDIFRYLFLFWGGTILLAFLISRSVRGDASGDNGNDEGD